MAKGKERSLMLDFKPAITDSESFGISKFKAPRLSSLVSLTGLSEGVIPMMCGTGRSASILGKVAGACPTG